MAQTTVPPVFLVTGFLGSGKTVFLQSLLDSPVAGTDNAVIVNDFGETVYDDFLLRARAASFLELPGGCLCCSALDDFKQALTDVAMRSPVRILVETTGLADAASVRDDLHFMGFPVDAVLCTADALHWRQHREQFALFEEQIREADYILISKSDLVDAHELGELRSYLQATNERAPIVCMKKGHIDADTLLAMLAPADHVVPRSRREQLSLVDDTLGVFRILLPQPMRRSELELCLARLPHTALRLKGRVALADDTDTITEFLLNFVNGRWTLTAVPNDATPARRTALALIGPHLAYSDVDSAFAGVDGVRVEQGELRFRLPEHSH